MSQEYISAAKIVDIGIQGKSIKKYCASLSSLKKGDYALGMQCLKFLSVIQDIVKEVDPDNSLFGDFQQPLVYVMIYDLLFSNKKKISGGGQVKRAIIEVKDLLFVALDKRMEGKAESSELLSNELNVSFSLPVYLRINVAKLSLEEGLTYVRQQYDVSASFDNLIPSLLQLPSSVKGLGQDPYIKEGKMFIQDKASCFPSQILFNVWNSSPSVVSRGNFLDACSAPGNKTSHLAALLLQSQYYQTAIHKVFACEKNPSRFKTLLNRMKQLALDPTVRCIQKDFLSIDVSQEKYQTVTHIMLDPSCSGSGIVRNIERLLGDKASTANEEKLDDNEGEVEGNIKNSSSESFQQRRLQKLQSFQLLALQKAISFPNVQYVVYSTCSIHQEENEIVVSSLLNGTNGELWELVAPNGFESWSRRGQVVEGLTEDEAEKMIRCLPVDGTNGFFVALLKRKQLFSLPVTLKKNDTLAIVSRDQTVTKLSNDQKKSGVTSSHVTATAANHSFKVSNRKKRKFSKI
jgi:putative methyltransferase